MILLVAGWLCLVPVHAQHFVWGRAYQSPFSSRVYSVAVGKKDNIFIAGQFTRNINLGTHQLRARSGEDGFLARIDSTGTVLWAKAMGVARLGSFYSTDVDREGNLYVSGAFSDSLYLPIDTLVSDKLNNGILAKYNEAGDLQWIRQFPDRIIRSIKVDIDGDIYVLGQDFSTSILRAWVGKFDKSGNQISDTFISSGGFVPANMAIDPNRNIYLSGIIGPNMLIGNINYDGGPWSSFAIVKCNADAIPLWGKPVDDIPLSGASYTAAIAVDGHGNIYHSTYTDMLFLSKRDTDGNILWSLRDDKIFLGITEILFDERGNLITTGLFRGDFTLGKVTFSSLGNSTFVGLFNNRGECQWYLQGKNASNSFPFGAARSQQTGDIYMGGYLNSKTPSFGQVIMPESSGAFLLKVSPGSKSKPVALNLGKQISLCEGRSVNLVAKGFLRYKWEDGSTDSMKTVTEFGKYYVRAVDLGGNVQSDTVYVKKCFESTIPNVITPNNDAYNQFFVLQELDLTLDNALIIFDRWGKRVYSTTAYKNNWDGSDLDVGTYYYELLNASDLKMYKGWVQIIK